MDNIKGYVQQIHSEFYKKLLPKVKNESRKLVVWNRNSTFLIDFYQIWAYTLVNYKMVWVSAQKQKHF